MEAIVTFKLKRVLTSEARTKRLNGCANDWRITIS